MPDVGLHVADTDDAAPVQEEQPDDQAE
uniref:Transcriptional regulator n=1 Tax=Globodera pallida TaxID=36090 RepID=A0A183CRV3_GLOPA